MVGHNGVAQSVADVWLVNLCNHLSIGPYLACQVALLARLARDAPTSPLLDLESTTTADSCQRRLDINSLQLQVATRAALRTERSSCCGVFCLETKRRVQCPDLPLKPSFLRTLEEGPLNTFFTHATTIRLV